MFSTCGIHKLHIEYQIQNYIFQVKNLAISTAFNAQLQLIFQAK